VIARSGVVGHATLEKNDDRDATFLETLQLSVWGGAHVLHSFDPGWSGRSSAQHPTACMTSYVAAAAAVAVAAWLH